MSSFLFLLLAGLAWMALLGDPDWDTFIVGVVIGAVVRQFEHVRSSRSFSPGRAFRFAYVTLRLMGTFLWELLVANIQQLRIILSPRLDIQPCWLEFRTELETPAMRALLGVMVVMTPGTVTCDELPVEGGGWSIALHVLDARDPEEVVERIRSRLEAPLHHLEQL